MHSNFPPNISLIIEDLQYNVSKKRERKTWVSRPPRIAGSLVQQTLCIRKVKKKQKGTVKLMIYGNALIL